MSLGELGQAFEGVARDFVEMAMPPQAVAVADLPMRADIAAASLAGVTGLQNAPQMPELSVAPEVATPGLVQTVDYTNRFELEAQKLANAPQVGFGNRA